MSIVFHLVYATRRATLAALAGFDGAVAVAGQWSAALRPD